jgi:hypothetical protein
MNNGNTPTDLQALFSQGVSDLDQLQRNIASLLPPDDPRQAQIVAYFNEYRGCMGTLTENVFVLMGNPLSSP